MSEDLTLFDASDQVAIQEAAELGEKWRIEMGFTSKKHKNIKCAICHKGIQSEAQIVEHARSTGHTKYDIDT